MRIYKSYRVVGNHNGKKVEVSNNHKYEGNAREYIENIRKHLPEIKDWDVEEYNEVCFP